ncbi:pyridine nucleotide-disulfide oxidoreductase [Endozoicomonas montiporae]|uniref:Soluble pyridine nucleotide transhydrogenase n=2 Tax=Endozoicomonas montiporae TaxID=1027273 RepID=A0A081NAF1_9GAMM|nr:Si-specific NAD(P)(+) transhydrogenase [Endozoicomonas montiporae]AMO56898.1 pyridine nucleotide transhydrogenase [Endozoicomonas montiporae CL-33]KEQ15424.1 pyridine nucleotide-disulfide oxidoreductase [Endozoicomonas montiporae]
MGVSNYDLVILGSGPAGEGAAMNAVKLGKKVAVVEQSPFVGGSCTHLGTIPSKALRHSVKQIMDFNTNPLFREIGDPRWFSFPKVLKSAEKVIQKQVQSRTMYYSRNRIDLYFGRGTFVDEHTIEVIENGGNIERLHATNIMIATGSRPYRPADVDFTHPRVFDSDTILELTNTPRRMIIYGAGVIGSEYASIFSGLGVLVDLVDTRDRLLSFLDKEISDALGYQLRKMNVIIRHNEEYQKVETLDDGVVMHLKSGKKLKADLLLWANGRTGNTQNMGLELIGLKSNSRGQLEVDQQYRTNMSHISAAGDVIGWPSLASAAYDQGRSAAGNASSSEAWRYVSEVPTGIYTIPEISSLGATEEELTAASVPYEVGKALFSRLARAQITGEKVGMLKILFHRDTEEVLGIHCFGDQASEIVHIGQAVMAQKGKANSIRFFLNSTFNYPTMAEAYRVAALDGINRLF